MKQWSLFTMSLGGVLIIFSSIYNYNLGLLLAGSLLIIGGVYFLIKGKKGS
ncbi:MAG: hypothetical protein ACK5G7_03570 [Erysipelotrichaceae bacterium]